MRVVLGGFPIGLQMAGTSAYAAGIVRGLAQVRPDVDLVWHTFSADGWLRRGQRDDAPAMEGLHHVVTPLPRRIAWRIQSRGLPPARLLVGKYDVYHQLHLDIDPAVSNEDLVLTVHDTVALRWPEHEGSPSPFLRSLVRRAAAVITPSRFSMGAIIEDLGIAEDRLHVVPNGVDHVRFTPPSPSVTREAASREVSEGRPYVLVLGGTTPRKNLARAVAAFASAQRNTDYPGVLVIAGAFESLPPEAKQAASALGGSARVTGYIPDDLLPTVISGADALLFPSLYEGFGLPILEAMACGTPVVTSATTACGEVAGEAAVLVNPEQVDDIASGLGRLLSDDALRSKLVAQGLARSATYSWERSAEGHAQVYEQVSAS